MDGREGRVKKLIREHRYREAIRVSRSLESTHSDYLTARAYYLLGERESDRSKFIMAESFIRKALELDPLKRDYHDLLLSVSVKLKSLDRLSSEYSQKLKETGNEFYRSMNSRVSTVSVTSIPQPKKRKGRKNKRSFLVKLFKYQVLPVPATFLVTSWFIDELKFLRVPLTAAFIVFLVYIFLISRRTRKGKEGW